jgi:hypothetical protein
MNGRAPVRVLNYVKLPFLILLTVASAFAQQKSWRQTVADRLPYFGEGNWIVVADSAFPMKPEPGIEMILSDDSHLNTVRHLLNVLEKEVHVRPVIYTDTELKHVPEQDAPGIEAYRQLFSGLLDKLVPQPPVHPTPQAGMMHTIEGVAKSYNVLIIKTTSILPYTTVFIELKTGYWQDDAEQRLRQSIR